MLRILKDNNIKVTFFFGGEWASKNVEMLRRIYQDGHELGNHGYKHLKQSQLTRQQNINEILKTEEVIKRATGYQTKLFAPPYGDINDLVTESAESINYKVIMWSIDTIDWNTKDYNQILNRINAKHHNGAIILMHPTKVTVEALQEIINTLKKHHYKIGTVSDVLE
jgi:peptidoglycan/xylan/chitin deacetylase (PgdA/CDA1 family)